MALDRFNFFEINKSFQIDFLRFDANEETGHTQVKIWYADVKLALCVVSTHDTRTQSRLKF